MKHILSDRALNREILRLSVPSILANLTVPLVGMVDTALAGHLVDADGGSAVFIGGISVGAMLLNLLYWNFFFLRTGTGGLTAQAFGRENRRECADIFFRGLAFAAAVALLILVLQRPLARLGLLVVSATPRVCELALRYFSVRIWAVPATLGLMVFRGWFVGMQDSMSSMWTDLVVNITNIWASVVLTFGIFGWGGIGFDGIAAGTLVAQYAGLAYAISVCFRKYRHVLGTVRREDAAELLRARNMVPFLKMNGNLLGRSLCFTGIYMGYTIIASAFGDVLLACSSIMMQLLMIFSYFTDGFAYAGEPGLAHRRAALAPVHIRRRRRGDLPALPAVAARDAAARLRRLHLGRHLSGRHRLPEPFPLDGRGPAGLFRHLVRLALAWRRGFSGWNGGGWNGGGHLPSRAACGLFRASRRPHRVPVAHLLARHPFQGLSVR